MNDHFAEMAQKWGEEMCVMMRRASCDRFPNGCPECPAQFAYEVAALLRRVDAETKHTPEQDTGANAYLIAAAPDLLEALESIESFAADVHPDSYRAFVRNTCRAAIARARGEG